MLNYIIIIIIIMSIALVYCIAGIFEEKLFEVISHRNINLEGLLYVYYKNFFKELVFEAAVTHENSKIYCP